MSNEKIVYDYIKTVYSQSISDFRKCSMDDNHNSLCNLEVEAINFDDIATTIYTHGGKLSSIDTLYYKKELYFVEFKGGNFGNSEEATKLKFDNEVKNKIIETLFTLYYNILPQITPPITREVIKINLIIVIYKKSISRKVIALKRISGNSDYEMKQTLNGLLKKYEKSNETPSKDFLFNKCVSVFNTDLHGHLTNI